MDNPYPDIMIDLETTGTSPEHAAIIQIAAIKFNYNDFSVQPEVFDRCLNMPVDRFWEEDTRNWWNKRRKLLESIQNRGEDPRTVIHDFFDWLCPGGRLWAKPTHFEQPLLASYFKKYEKDPNLVIHFRPAMDMNSFIRGLFRVVSDDEVKEHFTHPEFVGEAHNALHDVAHQIKTLQAAKDAVS